MPKSKSSRKSSTKRSKSPSSPRKSKATKVACPKSYKKVVYNSEDKKGTLCEKQRRDDDWGYSSSDYSSSSSSSSDSEIDGVFAHRAQIDHLGNKLGDTDYNDYHNIGAGTFNLNHATCKDLPAGNEGELQTLPNGKVCRFSQGNWKVLNPTTEADCKINFPNDRTPRSAKFLKETVKLDNGTTYNRGHNCIANIDLPEVEWHLSELERQARIATLAIDKYDDQRAEVQALLQQLKSSQIGYQSDAAKVEKSIREQSAALYKKREEISLLEQRLQSAKAKASRSMNSSLEVERSNLASQAAKDAARERSIAYMKRMNNNAFGYLDEAGRRGINDSIKRECNPNSDNYDVNYFDDPTATCGQYVVLPWLLKLAENNASAMRNESLCTRINKIMSIKPNYKFMDKGVSHDDVCGGVNSPQSKAVELVQTYIEHMDANVDKFSNKQRENMQALLASVNYVSTDCHNCKETAGAYADAVSAKKFAKGQPPKMTTHQRYFF